jgi:hypothetical protein
MSVSLFASALMGMALTENNNVWEVVWNKTRIAIHGIQYELNATTASDTRQNAFTVTTLQLCTAASGLRLRQDMMGLHVNYHLYNIAEF